MPITKATSVLLHSLHTASIPTTGQRLLLLLRSPPAASAAIRGLVLPDAWGLGGLGKGLAAGGVGQGKALTSAFEGAAAFNNLVSGRAPQPALRVTAPEPFCRRTQLPSRCSTQGAEKAPSPPPKVTSTLKDLTSSFTSFLWPGFGGLGGAAGSGLGIFRSGAAAPPAAPGSKAEPYPFYPFFGRHEAAGCILAGQDVCMVLHFWSPSRAQRRPNREAGRPSGIRSFLTVRSRAKRWL